MEHAAKAEPVDRVDLADREKLGNKMENVDRAEPSNKMLHVDRVDLVGREELGNKMKHIDWAEPGNKM